MSIKYGLTIENQNKIIDKATTKTDGVYSFRGIMYRVKNHRLTHLAYGGKLYQCAGNFNVFLGQYYNDIDAKKHLKEISA